MTDHITLPRAVGLHIRNSLRGIVNASDDDCGEEKCRECAPVRVMREALAALDAALAEPDAIAAKYNELLMAVWQKHPGETRHETALRYITQAEQRTTVADQAKEDMT